MAVQNRAYDKLVEYMGDATIDADGDTWKFALFDTNHSYSATNTTLSQVSTNEVSGSGYAQDTLTVTWTESSGTVTFDSDDPTFTASGGALAASDGVLYDDTPSSPADPLALDIDFDGEQSAGDGTDFIVAVNASGWFTAAYTDG